MSEEKEFSANQDPQKLYTNILIKKVNQVNESIYFVNRVSMITTLNQTEGIISFLDAKSQKDLEKIHQTIREWLDNTNLVTSTNQVKDLFSKLVKYLHQNQLQYVKYAKPTHGSGHAGL